ncbi:hypothetical protein ROZALSC1DRAFT_29927 [Rozella allomycis CSF55]|uniref:Uncharacterized protein n=1 Tax=Rozella allomycis (strain CSF55) TaxID=988480 RepID=A0A075AVU6_ROZAC|nr:hypothetical protein O9G_005486 [Rozella allomycis CSF55]RKP18385.1 hypothetical protein ROZALSC1DRAFT_29927 [Rozella allomycis CSF55]|eukprot:EPZ32619.1 hypothetical protein O9G_005486 [Rozella allomycis CSF55]
MLNQTLKLNLQLLFAGLPRALVNDILNDKKYSLKDLKKMNLEELFPILCEYAEKNDIKRDFVKSLDEKSDNYENEIQKFQNSVFELPNKKFQKLNKNIDEKELNKSIMFNARPNECMCCGDINVTFYRHQNNKCGVRVQAEKVNNNLFKVQEYPKFPIHENALLAFSRNTDVEANVMNQKRQNEDNY